MTKFEVPLVDMSNRVGRFRDKIHEALDSVISSGNYILGDAVRNFEDQFAEFCQSQMAVAVGNGTDAITLTLRSLNLPPNSEVEITSLSPSLSISVACIEDTRITFVSKTWASNSIRFGPSSIGP